MGSTMRFLIFFLVFALLAAYTLQLPSGAGMSGCSCIGFLHNGEGNCYGKSALCGGNNWCYIANSSTCEDAQTSINGAPYRWSCLACKKGSGSRRQRQNYCQKLVSYPITGREICYTGTHTDR